MVLVPKKNVVKSPKNSVAFNYNQIETYTMTTFITFTETRKKQIDHLRARVMEERPVRHVSTFRGTDYVTITRPLSLIDYAVYAALRGADYRKGDHTGGKVATQELKGLIARFKAYGTGSTNLLPSGSTVEEIAEFIEALEVELVKWKDAPTVN